MACRTCVCRGLRCHGLAQPRVRFHAVWDRALGTRDRLSFAAFFVLGKRIWPFMVVAVAAADLIVRGHDFPLAAQIFAPIIIGGGYAIALTTLANPKWRFDPALRTFRDVQLLEATAIVSSILIAFGYAARARCHRHLAARRGWTCHLRVCDRRPHWHFGHRAILAASARIWNASRVPRSRTSCKQHQYSRLWSSHLGSRPCRTSGSSMLSFFPSFGLPCGMGCKVRHGVSCLLKLA